MNRKLRLFLIVMIGIGAVSALWITAVRWRVEARQRSVEIVADWTQVQQISVFSNVPMDQLLGELQRHGVGGMAVSEDTIGGLRDDGYLIVEADPTAGGGARTLISSMDAGLLDRVREHLSHKVRIASSPKTEPSKEGYTAFVWPGSFEQLRGINVGLPPGDVQRLRDDGFDVVARIVNYQNANHANIDWSLKNLARMGIGKIVFGGEEVLGYAAQVKETAALMQQEGLVYGSAEFSKQRGDEELSLALKGDFIRVHSITPAEMSKLKPEEMIERYVRAAEERNIRIAFVRFLPFATERGWIDQLTFLDEIAKGIQSPRSGLKIGPARVYPALPVPKGARWLIGAGAAAAAVWLLATALPMGEGVLFLIFVAVMLINLGLLVVTKQIGFKLVALEAAIVFPTLSIGLVYGFLRDRLREERRFSPVPVFLALSGFSGLGALYVVGLLSSREYMVKAQEFMGIKAAHIVPLLILGIALSLDFIVDHRTREEMIDDARRRLRRFLSEPILVWQMLAAIIGFAALVILLLRSGNDPGVGVSPIEMRFRAILDRILYVRPRTKEFLIGHPVMILALTWAAAWARPRLASAPRWALSRAGLVVLLVVGGIGQVSLVNTFCHIHTPLSVSILHMVNGLWVGAILGAILFALLPKGRRESPEIAERGAAECARGR